MKQYHGSCHCGVIEYTFSTAVDPAQMQVRGCRCRFCQQNGALNVSDPQGHVDMTVQDSTLLQRYRFGLKSAEFFICKHCGAYIGAVMQEGDGACSTININMLKDRGRFSMTPVLADYDVEYEDETAAARIERRKKRWTPTTIKLES